jgi:DNA mismatch endonuclease (patch repair protein)
MRAVKSTGNRTTELALRMALVRASLVGWRVRPSELPGHPDFTFVRDKLAVSVDGCFWHGCRMCHARPVRSNAHYWRTKLGLNQGRDRLVSARLRRMGWRVVRIWEHSLKCSAAAVVSRIERALNRAKRSPGRKLC